MQNSKKSVLLISMPYAWITIPSIQLQILENYLIKKDVNVKTRHLYLKAADFYGLTDYNHLIYPPNDSYNAQIFFIKHVFPDHWNQKKEEIKEFFNKEISRNYNQNIELSFDRFLEKTDNFLDWILKNVEWKDYDIIGFSLNYGQLLPSLAFSKKIKEIDPDKKIIFGGSRTVDELGVKILESFDYIDFIVSGDGEEALYKLVVDYNNYKKIPRLIYKEKNQVLFNKSENVIDLNSLPTPNFDSFYLELENCSNEIQENFHLNGRLPIEISRGCWWNKCNFCNLNVQHKNYREKTVDKIIEEIEFLSDRYKILSFQFISNTILKNDHKLLLEKIIQLNKDFTFFIESRAGHLKSDDYTLLKKAGFITIQTGIETFSENFIKKMNKGARVIDNIASLKYCKENSISNAYNLIIGFPNEEEIDFEETKKNIQLFKQYIDPPNISPLIIGFGSPIYNNPSEWNIEKFYNTKTDKIMFPQKILDKNISFFYKFDTKHDIQKNNWNGLIDEWKKDYEKFQIEGVKKQTELDKLIFYFQDGGDFIKIYDKRNPKDLKIFILDELEREVLLNCIDVIAFEKLHEKLSAIEDFKLAAILHSFEKNNIIFKEDNFYLTLPLNYSTINQKEIKEKPKELVYSSGSQRSL